MNSSNKKLALISTLSIMILSSCSSDSTIVMDANDDIIRLTWGSCGDVAELECGSLEVPIDYSNPGGEKMDIALIRKKATGADRIGTLLFNPGGPGASGLDSLKFLVSIDAVPAQIEEVYDFVSFDPRGLGESKPVDCSEFVPENSNGYPVSEADIYENITLQSEFAENCSTKYGDYLQHLSSVNVVRDMESMREALREDEMNFIGVSYGTRLAALYLQEYPEHSGRIVLDAAGSKDPSYRAIVSGQLLPKQANLLSTLSLCTNTDPNCNPNVLLSTLENRINQIYPPMSQAEGMEFGLLMELLIPIGDDPGFGQMASASLVAYLNTMDVSILESFLQQLSSMGGSEDDGPQDNRTLATAVLCADDAERPDADKLVMELDAFNQISDVYAEFALFQYSACAGWPAALEPAPQIATNTAPVSLVIGGTTDGQAPLIYSQEMAAQLGGIFISSNHLGHTAVFNDESPCVDDLVEKFLLDGMVPADTVCE